MKYSRFAVLLMLVIACVPALPAQTVTPARAFPGQIIELAWDGPNGSSVKLGGSIATADIRTVSGTSRRAYCQVPPHSPGSVTVEVPGSGKTFSALEILPGMIWPEPRIEDVSILSYAIKATDASGLPTEVDVTLAISAANLQMNGGVSVNRFAVPEENISFGGAITSSRFAAPPNEEIFAYPVLHTTLLYAELTGWDYDNGVLTVEVRNQTPAGNKVSAPKRFVLPTSMAELDRDGDGLSDDWEATVGMAIGCTPTRKDILVEVDWMASAAPVLTRTDPSTGGTRNIWAEIQKVFSNAPVLNPDGSRGIRLYIDAGSPGGDGGEIIPDYGLIDFCPPVNDDQVNYYDVRSEYFSLDRIGAFHYCVFANGMPEGRSGRAEVWGGDLIVSVQDVAEHYIINPADGMSPTEQMYLQKWQIGTFIHELGHNLSLHHGGPEIAGADREELYKPNQPSIMNYLYQMCGLKGGPPFADESIFTYSQGMRHMRDESNTTGSLAAIADPECLNYSDASVDGDLNYDFDAADKHYDYDEWGNLRLSIPLSDCMGCICYGAIQWNLSIPSGGPTEKWIEYHLKSVSSGMSSSSDGGKSCPPPMVGCGPGDTLKCGDYIAFVVVDCDTFYFKGDRDTVSTPGDTTGIEIVRVTEGMVDTLFMVIDLQDTSATLNPPVARSHKGPVARVLLNGSLLHGTQQIPGNITTLSDNTALLVSGSDSIRLAFRFPTSTPADSFALKQLNAVTGALDLRSISSPTKTDQVISLLAGADLAVGYIWLESPQPIAYEPIPGLVLAQEPVTGVGLGNSLKRVRVSILGNPVIQGRMMEVLHQGVTYHVFVHTSAYRKSIAVGDEVTSGYILRAVILQE